MTAEEYAQLAWDIAITCAQQEPDKYFKECFLLNVKTQIRQAETAARRKALEEAAAVAGTLAERPYDSEPEFSCATTIEAHIRALIKEVK